MTAIAPPVSVPIVWIELVARDPEESAALYAAVLGWRGALPTGRSDREVFLDAGRQAGPICGIRARTPADPVAPAPGTASEVDHPVDRWAVRLAPPRPPRAVDPGGDQLLRPRAPGPRIGRWAAPRAFCFAELVTPDPAGAADWLRRRLDAVLLDAEGGRLPQGGVADADALRAGGCLLLASSLDQRTPTACLRPPAAEGDDVGWIPAVQVAQVERVAEAAVEHGCRVVIRSPPPGAPGTRAATLTDPGGAVLTLLEAGPVHGRR